MLLERISSQELQAIDKYRDYYAYSGEEIPNTSKAPISYILRDWNKKKETLYHLLGKELMVSKNITIQTPFEALEEAMNDLVNRSSFCDWFYELRRNFNHTSDGWDQIEALTGLLRSDYLAKNKYEGETVKLHLEDKVISVPTGCKPLRIISKIASIYGKDEEFEQFRINHSMVLNKKELHGELVLSIHPLDYMTMSDNNSNWSSCMSWQDCGCYRRGTVEMMNSPMVVVAYLKAEKDMILPTDLAWSNKKWRELIIVTPGFITNIKAYPYRAPELSTIAVETLAVLAKENLGWEYEEGTIEYRPFHTFDHNEKEYYFSFETDAMYNDMDSGVKCVMKMAPNLEKGIHNCFYSGEAVCMHCGEYGEYRCFDDGEGSLICSDCNPVYYCADCGERIYPNSEYVYEVDGETLCSYCYENHTVETVDDEEIHLEGNTHEIYVVGSVEGLDYSANSIRVYYDVDNLDKDFMEKYFTTNSIHAHYEGWKKWNYVLVDELTNEGLELFDLPSREDDPEEVEDYKIDYSLKSSDRYARRRAISEGKEWPPKEEEPIDEGLMQSLRKAILQSFAEAEGIEISL